jgi:hypothetical protein
LKSIDYFSVNSKRLAQSTNQRHLFIEDHAYDEKIGWIFKLRRAGRVFCLTEEELRKEGFAEDVSKYKKMIKRIGEVKEERGHE